jgi:TPR repeat protein
MRYKILALLLISGQLFSSTMQEAKKEFDNKNYQKAYNQFIEAAEEGMIAKYNIGYMNEQGLGVEKDINKAIGFYTMSANDGYDKAQFTLGNAYLNGIGVKQDLDTAINYYQLASQQNNAEAKAMLVKIQQEIATFKKDWPYVTIRSNLYDDKVYLNGKYIGSSKLTIQVPPNQASKIEVRKEGHKTYLFQDLILKPKQEITIKATLLEN